MKIGKSPEILKSTLGSCVGIGIVWKEKNKYALAHCLLPESEEEIFSIGAKYVTQAIPSLIALLSLKPDNIKSVDVYLVGGNNMLPNKASKAASNSNHIGVQNADKAEFLLKEKGFRIKLKEVGGDCPSQIIIDCESGNVEIVRIKDGEKMVVENS